MNNFHVIANKKSFYSLFITAVLITPTAVSVCALKQRNKSRKKGACMCVGVLGR